ncbi:hypothetical protein [Anaerosolibacter carboniphilus]|nr:hypothetical protein [Anaerosolibacter carboniphilus]
MIRQTIQQKKLSFWKLLLMIFAATFIMNMAVKLFARISPAIGTAAGIVSLLIASSGCMAIIYKHIAYFNYKLIDDDLIMEKVFGRANHLFLSLKLWELEQFYPYNELDSKGSKGNVKVYKFVTGSNHDQWYVGEFTRSGDQYRFVIAPSEELLRAIQSSQGKN